MYSKSILLVLSFFISFLYVFEKWEERFKIIFYVRGVLIILMLVFSFIVLESEFDEKESAIKAEKEQAKAAADRYEATMDTLELSLQKQGELLGETKQILEKQNTAVKNLNNISSTLLESSRKQKRILNKIIQSQKAVSKINFGLQFAVRANNSFTNYVYGFVYKDLSQRGIVCDPVVKDGNILLLRISDELKNNKINDLEFEISNLGVSYRIHANIVRYVHIKNNSPLFYNNFNDTKEYFKFNTNFSFKKDDSEKEHISFNVNMKNPFWENKSFVCTLIVHATEVNENYDPVVVYTLIKDITDINYHIKGKIYTIEDFHNTHLYVRFQNSLDILELSVVQLKIGSNLYSSGPGLLESRSFKKIKSPLIKKGNNNVFHHFIESF